MCYVLNPANNNTPVHLRGAKMATWLYSIDLDGRS